MRQETFREHSNTICLIAVILFAAVSFGFPVLYYGVPDGYDLPTNLSFAEAYREAIMNGSLIPGWANDNLGYGSIGVRFYPPLPYYALAIGKIITGDWFVSLYSNMIVWMCLGCAGVYLFVKEWSTPLPAMAAGMIYAIVPHHLQEIYGYFLYAEFTVWAVLPFCFLFVTRICRGGKWSDVSLFAVSLSAVILTHIPTTVIMAFCLPIYVLVLLDWRRFKPVFLRLFIAIGLTIAATSFRLVHLVTEFNWLAHTLPEHVEGHQYKFSDWMFPNYLDTRKLALLDLTAWLLDVTIVLTISLVIPAIIYLFTSTKTKTDPARRIVIAATITTLFAFFMLSKPSIFIWNSLGFLQRIQFPYRWLSVLSLLAVVSFSLSIPFLMKRYHRQERLVLYSGLALIVAFVMFNITQTIIPVAPLPPAKFEKVESKLQTEPIWKAWWPIWAKEEAFAIREPVIAGDRQVNIFLWESKNREFTVQPGEPVNIRLATFYYPYWKATVNGRSTEIIMDENGVINIPVTSEAVRVRLQFEEPGINNVALMVSLITWLCPFFLIPVFYLRKYRNFLYHKPLLEREYDYF